MTDRLSAYVVADSGADFTCEIANLTPRSLFLSTNHALAFQEQVSVTFFSVEVRGEVALASSSPLGLLVVFDAPPAIRRRIEAHMAKTPAVSRPPVAAPIPALEEAPATEIIELEVELIHGLTSHAAQRPSSVVLEKNPALRDGEVPLTVQARPRRSQDAKLDNVVVGPPRRRKKRDQQQTTDVDPTLAP